MPTTPDYFERSQPSLPDGMTTATAITMLVGDFQIYDDCMANGLTASGKLTLDFVTMFERTYAFTRRLAHECDLTKDPRAQWLHGRITTTQHRVTSAGRETNNDRSLKPLLHALFRTNPVSLSSLRLYAAIGAAPLGHQTLVQKRVADERAPVFQFTTGGIKYLESTQWAMVLDQIAPPVDPDPNNRRPYYEQQECYDQGHHSSPFYRFHSRAWGKRRYADCLQKYGYEICPFLGHKPEFRHMNVTDLLASNQDAADLRYLFDAAYYLRDLAANPDWHSASTMKLPMLFLPALDEQGIQHYELRYVHDAHPDYAEDTHARRGMITHTTQATLRRMIIEEARDVAPPAGPLELQDLYDYPLFTDDIDE